MRRYLLSRPVVFGSAIATTFGVACIMKDFAFGEKYEGKELATDKVVIVTGANTGIGKAVARQFANRGAKVIMACRDMKKCEKARFEIATESTNKYVYCRMCDLASQQSIRQFVEKFKSEHKELHFLINNAGIMNCRKSYTQEGIEAQLGVNFMGHFLLTNLLLDVLKASAPSKIINVSDISYVKGKINIEDLNSDKSYDPYEAYYQSQLALAIFTGELDTKLAGTNVRVCSVYPGLTYTDITRHMGYQKSIFGKIWVNPVGWLLRKSPNQASCTILSAALNPNYKEMSGIYFREYDVEGLSENATQPSLNKWLWNVAEVWTNINTSHLSKS